MMCRLPKISLVVSSLVIMPAVRATQAQDLTAISGVPAVYFNDNSDSFGGNDFYLECQGGIGADTTHYCDLYDSENNKRMFWIDSTPSVVEMGIGTSAPTAALHLATPQTPNILLDSLGTDLQIGGSDDMTFSYTANSFGPTGTILTLENDLSGSLYPGLGIWNNNPSVPLHVGSHDNMSAAVTVQNTVAPTAPGDVFMYRLINTGTKIVRFSVDAGGSVWTFDNNRNLNTGAGNNSGQFRISKLGTGVAEFTVDGFGNGRFSGNSFAVNHVNTSSRAFKTDFAPVDEAEVLDQLAALPVTRWRYKSEAEGEAHIGPVAEDFQETFGLGDGTHISTVDASGVALVGLKGLHRLVQEKDAEIASLKQANADLAARLARLEAVVLTGN